MKKSYSSTSVSGYMFPAIYYNHTDKAVSVYTWQVQPGKLFFHPASAGQNSIARWKAPMSGNIKIDAVFTGIDPYPTTTDVAILYGSTELWSANINNCNIPISVSKALSVNAGDTIDFTVGYGSNKDFHHDSTGVDVNIEYSMTTEVSDTVYDYAKDVSQSYLYGNSGMMIARISKAYLDDGSDYSCEQQRLNYDMNTYVFSKYSYVINSVSYQNENGKQIAKINATQSMTWASKSDPGKQSNSDSTGSAILIFEDGKWKAYGNRKPAPGPSASGIVACQSLDSTTWTPVGIKNIFTSADNAVYIFQKVSGIYNGSVVYTKWYKPNGTLMSSTAYTVNWGAYPKCAPITYPCSSFYTIKGYETFWMQNAGTWRVEVYADNVKVGETSFVYQP